jgi:endonuclease YncB( thermonuclease family)
MRVSNLMLITTIAGSLAYVYTIALPTIKTPPPRQIVPVQAQQGQNGQKPDQSSPSAQIQSARFTPFPSTAQFETGDSWIADGKRYRLYGVQACLRGTSITIAGGVKRDCGELNLIMAQAIIRDSKPVCTTVHELDANNLLVVCQTTTGKTGYDLATFMIAQGWGFAATSGNGQLIVPGYRVAEEGAREARAGLWAYADLPHPVSVLIDQEKQQPPQNAATNP